MEQISLHVKLHALLEYGLVKIKTDPARHQPGEGPYSFNDETVRMITNFTGPSPDGSGVIFDEPTDLAFAPQQKVVLAVARSLKDEIFQPLTAPLRRRVA